MLPRALQRARVQSRSESERFTINILFAVSLAVALATLIHPQRARSGAKPKIVRQSEFVVVGISARTTNAQEMPGGGVIGKMWQRFMSEQPLKRIPSRTDSNILALYTNYESDANGAYTFVIGAKVTTRQAIPLTIPDVDFSAPRQAPLACII